MLKKKRFSNWNNVLGRTFIKGNQRGQIWVETVIYTLIAFTLISLVLAFVKPKIEEIQDKGIIEQSIKVLEEMDSIAKNIGSPGNQRVIRLGISSGTLNIDGQADRVFFDIESRYAYSEPGETINRGNIIINTAEMGSKYDVGLTLNYTSEYNITFQSTDGIRQLGRAATPYSISISNRGVDSSDRTIVDFDVVS